MLAYILAIIIAFTSIVLYLSAFFLPELHRQDDFLWSGIGLFYALVLWVCAERITGGILLGQSAAVLLIISFGWQTVRLRRIHAHPGDKTDITGFSLLSWIKSRLGVQKHSTVTDISSPAVETVTEAKELCTREVSQPISKEVSEEDTFPEMAETFIQESAEGSKEDTFPEMAETFIQESAEVTAPMGETETVETSSNEIPELLISDEELPSSPPTEEPIETPIVETKSASSPTIELEPKKLKKKGFFLSSLFRFIKPKFQPHSENITESSNQQKLDIDKENGENFKTLEKSENVEALLEKKAVIEHEVTGVSGEQKELATQQVKEEDSELSEQPQAAELEQTQEKKQTTQKKSIFSEEITRKNSEETPTIITDDQSQISKSFIIENSQETNLDTDNLETESSTSGFLEIFDQKKEEDRKLDENDKKSN